MTGDLILNLSRTTQSSSLLPAQAKKVDSLRDSPVRNLKRKNGTAPKAIYDSSPSDSSNDIASLRSECNNVESNNNNRNSKLSRIENGRLNSITSSVDEEEEQLIMDSSSNEHSECDDRKKNFNMIKPGCVSKNSSSSPSSNSSPTNTNSSNNIDDGGGGRSGSGGGGDVTDGDNMSSKNYSVLEEEHVANNEAKKNNRNNSQARQQQTKESLLESKLLVVSHSASMSSTTTTSSTSTTINRSEVLLSTPVPDVSASVPTSPSSLTTPLLDVTAKRRDMNSMPTSPECMQQQLQLQLQQDHIARRCSMNSQQQNMGYARKNDASGFRTSRSEDHLQLSQRESTLGNAIPIDIDEDCTSSLNTLLDTRHDSEGSQSSEHDRIVWTYNAPVPTSNSNQVITSPTSRSSSISTSPQHTDSPVSPTSVSSSVMTSSGSKGKDSCLPNINNGSVIPPVMTMSSEQSMSEAISNISSPDYQDEHDLLSARDLSAAMAISDPSDSDSTLIVDEKEKRSHVMCPIAEAESNRSIDPLKDSEDELATLTEEPFLSLASVHQREASPPISDDGSDVESLHSFHYSPKAVDMPSAIRLAKRLFTLDGFKKSDVSRHLSKK